MWVITAARNAKNRCGDIRIASVAFVKKLVALHYAAGAACHAVGGEILKELIKSGKILFHFAFLRLLFFIILLHKSPESK